MPEDTNQSISSKSILQFKQILLQIFSKVKLKDKLFFDAGYFGVA